MFINEIRKNKLIALAFIAVCLIVIGCQKEETISPKSDATQIKSSERKAMDDLPAAGPTPTIPCFEDAEDFAALATANGTQTVPPLPAFFTDFDGTLDNIICPELFVPCISDIEVIHYYGIYQTGLFEIDPCDLYCSSDFNAPISAATQQGIYNKAMDLINFLIPNCPTTGGKMQLIGYDFYTNYSIEEEVYVVEIAAKYSCCTGVFEK